MRVIGENWLQRNDPTLIVISENEDVGSLMRAIPRIERHQSLRILTAPWRERINWRIVGYAGLKTLSSLAIANL